MKNHRVQHIAITFADGALAIMQFVLDPRLPEGTIIPGYDNKTGLREATDEAIQHEIERSLFKREVLKWRRMDGDEIPVERTYRNAWRDYDTHIGHDMVGAVDVHMSNLREERAARLEQLDKDWMRATGQGKKHEADAVEAERQRLRDLPTTLQPQLEAAQTIDDLKTVWPF